MVGGSVGHICVWVTDQWWRMSTGRCKFLRIIDFPHTPYVI